MGPLVICGGVYCRVREYLTDPWVTSVLLMPDKDCPVKNVNNNSSIYKIFFEKKLPNCTMFMIIDLNWMKIKRMQRKWWPQLFAIASNMSFGLKKPPCNASSSHVLWGEGGGVVNLWNRFGGRLYCMYISVGGQSTPSSHPLTPLQQNL